MPTAPLAPVTISTPVIVASPIPPTPLPTPITYGVQKGDTLISIAWDFKISVEDLQAANPEINPRFLTVGAVLNIPSSTGNPVATLAPPTASPEPIALELSAPACYPTPTQVWYCFVEARNHDSTPLTSISAHIVLADAAGLPIADQIAQISLNQIPAGGSAPLTAIFAHPPAQVAGTGVRLLSAQRVTDPATAPYITLEAQVEHGESTSAGWRVTGYVTNPTTQTMQTLWVTLVLYDAAGAILGHYTKTDGNLAPGERRLVRVDAIPLQATVAYYLLSAEGQP
jgi:LysM repeat protein